VSHGSLGVPVDTTARREVRRHVIAAVSELPPGSRKVVEIAGRAIAVFNIRGEFFAVLNRCPHQGGALGEGELIGLVESSEPGQYRFTRSGEILRCPWHGWEFDLRTGRSRCDPARIKARCYDVSIEPGRSLVEGPYVAETFPVSLEEDYVVVKLPAGRSGAGDPPC
jgi:nitrite reductase/ring-hydroxylating ferredoxin subunit